MNLKLVRVSEVLGVTLGVLCVEGMPEFCTLEEAWRDNERQVSCIPAGTYTVKRVNSPKFGLTYEVTNVPSRSHILFHSGNTHRDTLGCILIGTVFGKIDKDPAVLNSRAAFARFMQIMGGKTEATLYVVDTCIGGRCH